MYRILGSLLGGPKGKRKSRRGTTAPPRRDKWLQNLLGDKWTLESYQGKNAYQNHVGEQMNPKITAACKLPPTGRDKWLRKSIGETNELQNPIQGQMNPKITSGDNWLPKYMVGRTEFQNHIMEQMDPKTTSRNTWIRKSRRGTNDPQREKKWLPITRRGTNEPQNNVRGANEPQNHSEGIWIRKLLWGANDL